MLHSDSATVGRETVQDREREDEYSMQVEMVWEEGEGWKPGWGVHA